MSERTDEVFFIANKLGYGWHTENNRHYAICKDDKTAHDALDLRKGYYWEYPVTIVFFPLLSRVELDAIFCSKCNGNGGFGYHDGSYSICSWCDMNRLLDEGSIDEVIIFKNEQTKQSWVNKIRRDCNKNWIDGRVIEYKLLG